MAAHGVDRVRSNAEDESIRELRNALLGRVNLSTLKRRCVTPPELRFDSALLNPAAGRASDLQQPGGFRRFHVCHVSPATGRNRYAEFSTLVRVLEPSLAATEFESWWSVSDGIYLGDRDAGHDFAFLRKYKITKILNCCGHALDNDWENYGISYLTYQWADKASQTILDEEDTIADEAFTFIEDGMQRGEGVLVQSCFGHSRSVCVLSAFLMRRHDWSLHETLEYIHFRCPSINPNVGFLRQLQEYEQRLQDLKDYGRSNEAREDRKAAADVELQLRDGETLQNTLTNCMNPIFSPRPPRLVSKQLRIQFTEDADITVYKVGSLIDIDKERDEQRRKGSAGRSKPLLKRSAGYAQRSPNSKLRPQSARPKDVGVDRFGRRYRRRAPRSYMTSKCFDFDLEDFQNLDRDAGHALNSLVAVAA
jgi:protein-tyrosine phosphatase